MARGIRRKTGRRQATETTPGPRPQISTGNIESDRQRAAAIAKAVASAIKTVGKKPLSERDDPGRVQQRKRLIYPADQLGLQRVLGKRDILQITFLHQALEAARPVCRLSVRGETPGRPSFGTGFLVAPGVLLTNHHVLDTPATAHLTMAQFDAELDSNYVERKMREFNLLPEKLFVTNAEADFTFVAVNTIATDGTPLSNYRWLPLLRESGKAVNGEWATIIQHPGGQTKQIVIRENRVVVLPEQYRDTIGPDFIHYQSDTERGSSGSPVLNDQFEVLALHHKAVPKFDAEGRIVAKNGKVWTEEMGESEAVWLANEGVRISAIFRRLDRAAFGDQQAASLLALLENGEPTSVFSSIAGRRGPAVSEVGEGAPLESTALARRKGKGYQADFLGFSVPLPKLGKKIGKFLQPLKDGASPKTSVVGEIVYTHFSVLMHSQRRFAIYTAANIDGAKRGAPDAPTGWKIDNRVLGTAQAANDLYKDNSLDKGHLVRKLDPAWGSTQQEINDGVIDTYHYTNAAPQDHNFNDGLWGNVEDYILQMAEAGGHKISVFTGPVFGTKDIKYGEERRGGPWRIPARFWKVIVYRKADGTRSATGFLLDQSEEIADLAEGMTPLPQARKTAQVHQKTVQEIEKLTNLDFGALRSFDPLKQLEATERTVRIRVPDQIVL